MHMMKMMSKPHPIEKDPLQSVNNLFLGSNLVYLDLKTSTQGSTENLKNNRSLKKYSKV
jgi:hypothetical protein